MAETRIRWPLIGETTCPECGRRDIERVVHDCTRPPVAVSEAEWGRVRRRLIAYHRRAA